MTSHISAKMTQPIVLVWGGENPRFFFFFDRDAQNSVLFSFKGRALWIPLPSLLEMVEGDIITAMS
jgi:hypothetical protein